MCVCGGGGGGGEGGRKYQCKSGEKFWTSLEVFISKNHCTSNISEGAVKIYEAVLK